MWYWNGCIFVYATIIQDEGVWLVGAVDSFPQLDVEAQRVWWWGSFHNIQQHQTMLTVSQSSAQDHRSGGCGLYWNYRNGFVSIWLIPPSHANNLMGFNFFGVTNANAVPSRTTLYIKKINLSLRPRESWASKIRMYFFFYSLFWKGLKRSGVKKLMNNNLIIINFIYLFYLNIQCKLCITSKFNIEPYLWEFPEICK